MKNIFLIVAILLCGVSSAQTSQTFKKVTATKVVTDSLDVDVITGSFFSQGSYLPTDSTKTNITSLTLDSAFYTKFGNVVTVSGTFTIEPASAAATSFYISLPIGMNVLGDTYYVGGAANAYSVNENGAVIYGTQLRAIIQFRATSTGARVMSYTYSYRLQ